MWSLGVPSGARPRLVSRLAVHGSFFPTSDGDAAGDVCDRYGCTMLPSSASAARRRPASAFHAAAAEKHDDAAAEKQAVKADKVVKDEPKPSFFGRLWNMLDRRKKPAVQAPEEGPHTGGASHGDAASGDAAPGESEQDKAMRELQQKMVADAEMQIQKANDQDIALYNQLNASRAQIPGQRKALNQVMTAHQKRLKKLCKEYLVDNASLRGLAGTHCEVVQGRINEVALPAIATDSCPEGCLSGTADDGIDKPLHTVRCSSGHRELACTRRLNYLVDRSAAPDEKFGGPSMDQQVRQFCHFQWFMPGLGVGSELASGLPDPAGEEPVVDDDDNSGLAAED